jgi:hypothetical protein
MFEPTAAMLIVRTLSTAYLLSSVILLSLTLCGWWIIDLIEHQDRSLPKWFS